MTPPQPDSPRRPGSRWLTLVAGVLIGFAWGTLMWALTTAFGQDTGGGCDRDAGEADSSSR